MTDKPRERAHHRTDRRQATARSRRSATRSIRLRCAPRRTASVRLPTALSVGMSRRLFTISSAQASSPTGTASQSTPAVEPVLLNKRRAAGRDEPEEHEHRDLAESARGIRLRSAGVQRQREHGQHPGSDEPRRGEEREDDACNCRDARPSRSPPWRPHEAVRVQTRRGDADPCAQPCPHRARRRSNRWRSSRRSGSATATSSASSDRGIDTAARPAHDAPTSTGTTAATSVRGRAPDPPDGERTRPGRRLRDHGRCGNFAKSGLRFSTYASRPSWASSLM